MPLRPLFHISFRIAIEDSELKWQSSFASDDIELGNLLMMAQEAPQEKQAGETEDKGFGEA